ncbi:MAG TPA: hypothetical protein VFY10_12990 [Dehalococcoidia bacterium]|nr:hypothetical protein [Dehalococcoidia bacterium]
MARAMSPLRSNDAGERDDAIEPRLLEHEMVVGGEGIIAQVAGCIGECGERVGPSAGAIEVDEGQVGAELHARDGSRPA